MSRHGDFAASLRLEANKQLPMGQPLQAAMAPPHVTIALDQGSGSSACPVVARGDRVYAGSTLGRSEREDCAAVHSPVAGVVVEIDTRAVPAGTGLCITVENDGSNRPDPALAPIPDYSALSPRDLLERFRNAGIAGLGGAAFPTATKLGSARQQTTAHLILNGAECEPWICCDDALMREKAADILYGARAMMHVAGANRCTVAIEDDKPEALQAIQAALKSAPEGFELATLSSLYPSGAERQLITALTGQEVPSSGLPTDLGIVCQNVGTAAAIARFLQTGEPLVRRVVTVTGSGIAQPANLEAYIGSPITSLIERCGGYRGRPRRLIEGGSMMGRALESDTVPITKATNCIFAATDADLVARDQAAACIRCGDCAQACPAGLLPQELHRAARVDDGPKLDSLGIEDCILCGCCDYVCPSRIPLTEQFRAARLAVRRHRADQLRAAEAKQRFERHESRLQAQAEAERRAFEEARRRARANPN